MIEKEHIQQIFQRFLKGESNLQEVEIVLSYFGEEEESEQLKEMIAAHLESPEEFDANLQQRIQHVVSKSDERMHAFVQEKLGEATKLESVTTIGDTPIQELNSRKTNKWWLYSAVASIFMMVGASLIYFNQEQNANPSEQFVANDIAPGGNRAILTLANGSTINLNDDQDGIIIGDQDIKYTDGTDLFNASSPFVIQSDSEGSLPAKQAAQLALTTPKGGQYQITLSDGTKVRLNAESTLKYPSHFNGKERRLELEGEAYFEVAHNSKQPFIVTSLNQEVTVLGTHFNISAYNDEKETKTTLIEGAVSVSANTLARNLTPGQQSTTNGRTLTVKPINTDIALAWTKGNFQFDSERIEQVMAKIARWYDVTIEYKGPKPTMEFNGFTSRGENVSEILTILERTGSVRFEIKGRRIIVMK